MTDNDQYELYLPAPPAGDDTPLIPARMVNEFVYCPRLAYLMWAQAEWMDTADTIEGKRVHKRVDKRKIPLPAPEEMGADDEHSMDKVISQSLILSSTELGVIARLDIAEVENGLVVPVDYKRSKRPHIAQRAYEPECIQICLQGLLLEEHGYRVEEGAIYYAGSRERVRVIFDDALRMETRIAVSKLRLTVSCGRIPPPLKDSPKCPRCALVTICLPDEVSALSGSSLAIRPIAVPIDDALPLVVQSQQARIGKEGDTLKVTDKYQKENRVRLIDISDVALFGNVSITTPALTELLDRDVPVTFHSHGGWFRGIAHGIGHRNVEVRTAQYAMSFSKMACLKFAQELVDAKIMNQRTILRRNWRGRQDTRKDALARLAATRKSVGRAATLSKVLGLEGEAAAVYFRSFAGLFRQVESTNELSAFRFDARNRRPPTDPINALLSFAYAMLTRHMTIALLSAGFDPYRGFYHAPRYGRPSLALDLMEPFRPIIADSVVLSAINNREIALGDFVVASTGTALTQPGRRRFIQAFERRLSQETTHPIFGYQVSMRRMLLIQARLLSRFLLKELPNYPHYLPR